MTAVLTDFLALARAYAADLHDHGGSAGAFYVAEGSVVEQTVSGSRLVEASFNPGRGRSFGPHYVHRIANIGERPATTVHVYGPALSSMTRYRLGGAGLVVEAVTRAGADW